MRRAKMTRRAQSHACECRVETPAAKQRKGNVELSTPDQHDANKISLPVLVRVSATAHAYSCSGAFQWGTREAPAPSIVDERSKRAYFQFE